MTLTEMESLRTGDTVKHRDEASTYKVIRTYFSSVSVRSSRGVVQLISRSTAAEWERVEPETRPWPQAQRTVIHSDYPRMPRTIDGDTWAYIPRPTKEGAVQHYLVLSRSTSYIVAATSRSDAALQMMQTGIWSPGETPVVREATLEDIQTYTRMGRPIPPLPFTEPTA